MAIGTREYQCENWNFYLLCSESHRCFGDSVEATDACSGKLQRGLKAMELFWLANHTQKPTKKNTKKIPVCLQHMMQELPILHE